MSKAIKKNLETTLPSKGHVTGGWGWAKGREQGENSGLGIRLNELQIVKKRKKGESLGKLRASLQVDHSGGKRAPRRERKSKTTPQPGTSSSIGTRRKRAIKKKVVGGGRNRPSDQQAGTSRSNYYKTGSGGMFSSKKKDRLGGARSACSRVAGRPKANKTSIKKVGASIGRAGGGKKKKAPTSKAETEATRNDSR